MRGIELGHSDISGMVDSLRQNRAHPTVRGCQTHALHGLPGECQNVISSCDQWKCHGTWSSPADGQFLLETPLEGGACQRHVVGGCLFKSSCDSGELHSIRNFLEMCQRRKQDKCYKNRGSKFTDVQKQS